MEGGERERKNEGGGENVLRDITKYIKMSSSLWHFHVHTKHYTICSIIRFFTCIVNKKNDVTYAKMRE